MHHVLSEKCSSEPETVTGLSAAAKNKQRAARWSSLLLGVSLRAGARASFGGVSQGFSDDSIAINTYTISALPCFILGLACAGELYIVGAARAISLMHLVLKLSSSVVHTLGCVARY